MKEKAIAMLTLGVVAIIALGLIFNWAGLLPTKQAASGLQLGCAMVKGMAVTELGNVPLQIDGNPVKYSYRFLSPMISQTPIFGDAQFVIGLDENACQNLKFGDKFWYIDSEPRSPSPVLGFPITRGAFSGQTLNGIIPFDMPPPEQQLQASGPIRPPVTYQLWYSVYDGGGGNFDVAYVFPQNYPGTLEDVHAKDNIQAAADALVPG